MKLRSLFFFFLFLCLASCQNQETTQNKQKVRVGIAKDPTTLDSRCARDLTSIGVIRMLFEGLMRISKEGKLEPALMDFMTLSEDRLTYTFHLKEAVWSNGDPITAFDFEYAWKTILDPTFPTDIAHHLYPIKNGREAKMGQVSLSEVGISVVSARTFSVQLEKPTPYFLELLATTPFFPVPKEVATRDLLWTQHENSLPSSGPFVLEKRHYTDTFSIKKNPLYWEEKEVHLDAIDLCVVSPDTGLRMFEEKKLDWMGSPLATLPPDAMETLKKEGQLQSSPFCATSFCRINTAKEVGGKANPLSQKALRRALSLSLNRSQIVHHILQGGQTEATQLVPESLALSFSGYFADHDLETARLELASAQDITEPLVIQYCQNERNALVAQAMQRQWEEALGLQIELEAIESKFYFQRVAKQEYQIAIGSWTADFNDPLNFLEVFKFQNNGMNNTSWESPEYIALLDASALCECMEERKEILRRAEKILMEEMPIIPIYHFVLNYVQNKALEGAQVSSQGYLDLRWATF